MIFHGCFLSPLVYLEARALSVFPEKAVLMLFLKSTRDMPIL